MTNECKRTLNNVKVPFFFLLYSNISMILTKIQIDDVRSSFFCFFALFFFLLLKYLKHLLGDDVCRISLCFSFYQKRYSDKMMYYEVFSYFLCVCECVFTASCDMFASFLTTLHSLGFDVNFFLYYCCNACIII